MMMTSAQPVARRSDSSSSTMMMRLGIQSSGGRAKIISTRSGYVTATYPRAAIDRPARIKS